MDSLFEEHRERQYTRELLFSTVVELMSVVAMGLRPSLHAAAKATEVGASLAALYDKVNRMEPALVRALVRGSSRCEGFGGRHCQGTRWWCTHRSRGCYNILAVFQAAIEAAHPQAKAQGIEISPFFVASEVKATYGGMMIAVAASIWAAFESPSILSPSDCASTLEAQRRR